MINGHNKEEWMKDYHDFGHFRHEVGFVENVWTQRNGDKKENRPHWENVGKWSGQYMTPGTNGICLDNIKYVFNPP